MPQPTHDQTLYRGDWILEHYIAILRQEIKWHQHTHTSHNPRTPGAYHPQHDHYDPDLLPQPTPTQPRYFNFTIPPNHASTNPPNTTPPHPHGHANSPTNYTPTTSSTTSPSTPSTSTNTPHPSPTTTKPPNA